MRSRFRASAATLSAGLVLALVTPGAVLAAAPTAGAPQLSMPQPGPHGYIEGTLSPGQSLSSSIAVSDGGTVPADFLVSAVDAYTSSASGAVYGNRAVPFRDGPNGNGEYGAGRWITVSASSVRLDPGQHGTIRVSVTVPSGTTPGDWVGGVTVENPAVTQATNGGTQLNITEATGIAVVVHVPGPVNVGAVFIDKPSVVAKGSQQFLEIPLRYTGDILVKPFFSFTLKDSHGKVVASHTGRFDTFLPHTTFVYEVVLDPHLAPGTYTFSGSAGPDSNVTSVSYSLKVTAVPDFTAPTRPGVNGAALPPGLWRIPALTLPVLAFPIFAALLGLVLLLALLLLLARRRRDRCTHCRRVGVRGLVTVYNVREIARCPFCRQQVADSHDVRLCPRCYRAHVLSTLTLSTA